MNIYIKKIKTITSQSKVFENYFFMTILKLLSTLIGMALYPYLIRTLGIKPFGEYIFAQSIISLFTIFVSFGLDLPNTKKIVENKEDVSIKSFIVSGVFTSKVYLFCISIILFFLLLLILRDRLISPLVFIICFSQITSEILFPIWYFQAVQKMKIVTYLQLSCRLATIPFILILVKTPEDLWVYACIISLSVILGGLMSLYIILKNEKIQLRFIKYYFLKDFFKEAVPFFWSNCIGTVKEHSATIIIGVFLGMNEVAVYDLAKKIIVIPRMLTVNINSALFPKIIQDNNKTKIKKIIKIETYIGLVIIMFIMIFGYWIVLFLGGKSMILSYPVSIILSITIISWLIVGAFINFIFIPQGYFYLITWNQIVAFFSFILACSLLFIYNSIVVVSIALAFSGICEIVFCKYLIKKLRLR
ncbi:oligosaccharide flippase family protein [Apibacter sp. HY039]|uniref:oligosaccharide flippase family protein n=1 Tax=Apibacter sp. HY039 TaxID=2501476 RepID=UPI000FEBBC41|nr:oligosaccharide flippase family protein [Apibacter sp. HY039]